MLTREQRQALARCYKLLLSLPDRSEEGVCRESDEAYDVTGEENGRQTDSSPARNPPAHEAGTRRLSDEQR